MGDRAQSYSSSAFSPAAPRQTSVALLRNLATGDHRLVTSISTRCGRWAHGQSPPALQAPAARSVPARWRPARLAPAQLHGKGLAPCPALDMLQEDH